MSSKKLWLLLLAGPFLFLIFIVAASIYFGAQGVVEAEIPQAVSALAAHSVVFVLGMLTLLMALLCRQEAMACWSARRWRGAGIQVALGAASGVALGLVYVTLLVPLHGQLQGMLGDYVPPGSVLPTVSMQLGLFFLANIVMAPLVEETLYRGIALPALIDRFGTMGGVLSSCVFFGLLHWMGGFWYMLMTGFIAGGLFALLYRWRSSVLAPASAHLALNAVEFAYAASAAV